MKRLRLIFLTLLVCFCGASCDVLDVAPVSVITTNSFWKTQEDAEGALNGMYVNLRSVSGAIYTLGEQRSEVFEGGVYGSGRNDLFLNELSGDQPHHPDWSGFYAIINSANLIIKYVPGMTFKSEAVKNSILAQAYSMRAYTYFVMTRTWGDLIIRTEPTETSSAEVTIRERAPQAEVFALIKSDIETALSLFPDNNFVAGRSKWSRAAVNTLKADVHLWTGKRMNGGAADFTTALAAIAEVEKADVSLLPSYADLFEYANKGNKETIMTIRYQDLDGASNNQFWLHWIIDSAIPANIDPATKALIQPVGGGQGLLVITSLVRNQFTEDDTRKKASFHEIFTYDAAGKPTFYTTLSMKGRGLLTGGTRLFLSDIVLYRYADVILLKAEAKNALDQDPTEEINKVRQRAYGANYSKHVFVKGTKQANDDAILKERLFELLYEGKRWWDLVRFGKAFDLVPNLQARKGQDHLLLFPIANTVLSLEPKVKQNPGYN
ncbi:RagB/SusD family nutrient uptake outer membrane protein [Dyadobacter fermentans]|uniref:RagB/SusD domain protein n=1 Tax=Dyadobacter fermentans (strain ATCC 700827 / DSM 18053 / CIP 107007 / KCTC 52180 / NS114) TaxID=471854 RepID=C6VW06_DYAFD|nr:RagB/SusD family nutrient uptake outer membrane protein [Dyadobacter fermentans]ACT93138.1 RagB/SusD domain protein [Dyadobacter fermentans DSM 18053]